MVIFAFEGLLLPTLVLIIGWGYQVERLAASFYLLVYAFVCSLPFLVIVLWLLSGSTLVGVLWILGPTGGLSTVIRMGLGLAFMVKLPIFLLHLWLPKAHVEAPTGGRVLLAGLLLKLGGYGILRLLGRPHLVLGATVVMVGLIGTGMPPLIGTFQSDSKSLVAYSSVGHINLLAVTLGIMAVKAISLNCALMVLHGVVSRGLFFVVGELYKGYFSRKLLLTGVGGTVVVIGLVAVLGLANFGVPPANSSLIEVGLLARLVLSSAVLGLLLVVIVVYSAYMVVYFMVRLLWGTQSGACFTLSSGALMVLGLTVGSSLNLGAWLLL